jgi:carboxyl-terminal processing protease
MKPFRLRLRHLAIAAALGLPLGFAAFVKQHPAEVAGARLFDQVLQLTSTQYVDTISTDSLYERAADGLVKELHDPYSVLFTPKEVARFTQQVGGQYAGIGAAIGKVNDAVTILKVFPNTPAAHAGVLEGDQIVKIDTFNTRGWSDQQVSDKLRGSPGTTIQVTFARPGTTAPVTTSITREIVHIPAVPYSLVLDDGIAYIPLQQFNGTAGPELKAAIDSAVQHGAKKLIVDLRGNPGGLTDQAIMISNLFLPQGSSVLSVRGRNGLSQTYTATSVPDQPTIPLVLLVNGQSASSSEIVAGSLQDHDRALIMGTTSFGKGLVQSLFSLDGGYALKLTIQKWYTPSGRSIQKERVLLPDGEFVEVHPDSLETDSARRARPQFKSDAGRIVYGGGGITPDIIVNPDTLTTAERKFNRAIAPKAALVNSELNSYANAFRGKVTPDFTVTPQMRNDFIARLKRKGLTIDPALVKGASSLIDRTIGIRIATLVFGDSIAKRKYLNEDAQLERAIQVLKSAPNQAALLAIAKYESTGTTALRD